MQTTTKTLNGWQNIGKVYIWLEGYTKIQLAAKDILIYMVVVRSTVGYAQYTSDILSYKEIAKRSRMSIRSVERTMPYLIEEGLIIRVATNQIAHTGKIPYKYQLNMKLEGFPSLGTLKSNREAQKLPDVSRYFIDLHGNVKPVYQSEKSNKTSKEWHNYIDAGGTAPNVVPTEEQLQEYLKTQNKG